MSATVLCARCSESTPREDACARCGEDPRLDRRYWLLEQLGHGAFGTTYRAERESDGATFAVKELLVRRLQDFKAHDLFKREANLLRSLSHPAIPAYVDDFIAGEGRHVGLYLVVDLVDGRTLADELLVRRLDMKAALGTVRELCDVLAYLHERTPPVVHRDLKPGNIMRRAGPQDGGTLALIDFGSVKDVVRQGEAGSTVAGTFGYMPPEQLAGRASPASDIYALGVVLLELVTRQPPHDLLDEQNRLAWDKLVDDGPLKDLLRDMLEPEPSKRIADAREVARRIDAILSGRAQTPAVAPKRGGGNMAARIADAVPNARMQRMMAMLQNAGVVGEPGQAEPPPDAPRTLPSGFGKKVDPVGHFFRIFGFFFGVPSTIILATVFGNMTGILGSFGGMMLPFLIFPVLGIVFFTLGFVRIQKAKHTYQTGKSAPAVVTDLSINTSLRVNGRSPFRIRIRYEAEGRERDATVSRFDLRPEFRVPGAQVFALYDPAKPDKAVLWPL